MTRIRIKGLGKQAAKRLGNFFIVLLAVAILSVSFTLLSSPVLSANLTNQTVLARVNITNTEPTLYNVDVEDVPIDLTPGAATTVVCNGSVFDANGFVDIQNVSAILFKEETGAIAPDDNSNHYTNASCEACTEIPNSGSQNGSCLCNFAVEYYAINGSWRCNMTVGDTSLLNSTNVSDQFTINEVLGIDVETVSLNYGNLSILQVSDPTRENVTNIGNVPINVTVRGYGGTNESVGINLSMICEDGANISFNAQRFALDNVTDFADMINLTNQTRQIPALTLPRRTDNTRLGNSSNATFWKLEVPAGPTGVCNGTIIFGGILARG